MPLHIMFFTMELVSVFLKNDQAIDSVLSVSYAVSGSCMHGYVSHSLMQGATGERLCW